MSDAVRTLLADIRSRKTCELRQNKYVTDAFLSIPPHRVGILHLVMEQRFLLADPVGGGKTPQALVAYSYLKEKDPSLRAVVVTLTSALFQWQLAVGKFLTDVSASVPGYTDRRGKSDPTSRKWQWGLDKSDVVVTTYHTLARDVDALLPHWDNFVLIFDEVQTVRNFNQKSLWPAAQRLSLKARYCWGLSATPIMNRLEDLFAVYEVIYPGLLGGSLTAFRKKYIREVYLKHARRWKTVGWQNLDQLKAIIAPYRLARPIEEISQYLPPVVNKPVLLSMGPKQRALYNQIVLNGFVPAAGDVVVDAMPSDLRGERKLVSLLYAQMAADAPAVLGHPDVPSVKWTELERFLKDECANGEKVIVFTRFERVVTWLSSQLTAAGITNTRITGVESAKVREAHRVAFQTDPAMQVMVIDGAGGSALDLQAGGIVVFYDLPWSWGMFKQVVGRSRRIGTSHPQVLSVQLLTTDSIDIYTSQLLHRKEQLVDLTFDLPNSDRIFTAPVPVIDQALRVADPFDFDLSSLYTLTRSGNPPSPPKPSQKPDAGREAPPSGT